MKSEDREGLYAHTKGASAGDIKVAEGTAGCNPLPDGSTAFTKQFIEDAHALSQAAQEGAKP